MFSTPKYAGFISSLNCVGHAPGGEATAPFSKPDRLGPKLECSTVVTLKRIDLGHVGKPLSPPFARHSSRVEPMEHAHRGSVPTLLHVAICKGAERKVAGSQSQ